jgi:hypothetical protein
MDEENHKRQASNRACNYLSLFPTVIKLVTACTFEPFRFALPTDFFIQHEQYAPLNKGIHPVCKNVY